MITPNKYDIILFLLLISPGNAIIVRNFDAFPDFEMVCEELKLYIPPLRMTESPAVSDLTIAALNVSGA